MLYSSTRGKDNNVGFTEAVLNGLARDGGLYIPNHIPKIKDKEMVYLSKLEYSELAYEITKKFLSEKDIPSRTYKKICDQTYGKTFGKEIITLKKLNSSEYILNLFHGPTYAFKDFALQLLGNIYDYILKKKKTKTNSCWCYFW